MKLKTLNLLLATAAMLAFNTACAENDNEAVEAVESAPAEAASVESAPAVAAAVESASPAEQAAPQLSEGMQIPVDGSNLEAFEKSLETIKGKVTEAEYTTLTNAVDYLLVYDLAARRDRTKLAANLNGLTGEQIVDKVQWGKNN